MKIFGLVLLGYFIIGVIFYIVLTIQDKAINGGSFKDRLKEDLKHTCTNYTTGFLDCVIFWPLAAGLFIWCFFEILVDLEVRIEDKLYDRKQKRDKT